MENLGHPLTNLCTKIQKANFTSKMAEYNTCLLKDIPAIGAGKRKRNMQSQWNERDGI